jgi:quinol monooxygenase YgiN
MVSVVRFAVDDAGADEFASRVAPALRALAAREGYLGGHAARATDDPQAWVLITEWRDVGSYRRALGSYDVTVAGTALLAESLDPVSAYEVLLSAAPGAEPVAHRSDRDLSGTR